MNKGNILVISRTPWNEMPRIRHQISRLLSKMGYEVYYLSILFKKNDLSVSGERGIHVFRINELIHHQLKPFKFLQSVNNYTVKKKIANTIPNRNFNVIFNFNYDFHFINSLFPEVPVITIINDDFIAMAKPWMKLATKRMLVETCEKSDKLLSVSYSIDLQLKKIAPSKPDLFFPWADMPYVEPRKMLKRDVVLYFGFISRLDESVIEGLCENNIRMRFVGPVEGNGAKLIQKFEKFPNIEFLPAQSIDKVFLDDVCCSIALYDSINPATIAITASNRMFRLLSLGLPLVYPCMPNLIKAPDTVISKCKSVPEFIKAIQYFKSNFDFVQSDIRNFLQDHTMGKRAAFLQNLIDGLQSHQI